MNRSKHSVAYLTMALCLFTFAALDSEPALAKMRRPHVVNYDAELPPHYVVNCGNHGDDVLIFPDPLNNYKDRPRQAVFYYTPLFYLSRLLGEESMHVRVLQDRQGDVPVQVTLFREWSKQLPLMRNKMSRMFEVEFTDDNFQPLEVRVVNLTVEKNAMLPFRFYEERPSEDDDETNVVVLGATTDITALVPKRHLDEFLYRVDEGLNLVVRYAFVLPENKQNTLDMVAEIKLDDTLKNDIFVGRQSRYATQSQVLEMFRRASRKAEITARLRSGALLDRFMSSANSFLEDIKNSETRLGDLLVENIKTHSLNINSPFFFPDFDSSTSEQSASDRSEHNLLKSFYQYYEETMKKGGGGFLGIGGGGQSGKAKGTTTEDLAENLTIERAAKASNWTGMKMKTLEVKLYDFQETSLEQHIELHIDAAISEQSREHVFWSLRNTVYHSYVQ